MTASHFVSVSSQRDTEEADIEREKIELKQTPESEFIELAVIYERRGLKKETAVLVAKELTEKGALAAHVIDEWIINEISQAKSLRAALIFGITFIIGGALPLLVTMFLAEKSMEYTLYGSTIISLIILGVVMAETGRSSIWKGISELSFGVL